MYFHAVVFRRTALRGAEAEVELLDGAALTGAIAEKGFQQLGTAGAIQTRYAQDLALVEREAGVAQLIVFGGQALHHDHRIVVDDVILGRIGCAQLATAHVPNDLCAEGIVVRAVLWRVVIQRPSRITVTSSAMRQISFILWEI